MVIYYVIMSHRESGFSTRPRGWAWRAAIGILGPYRSISNPMITRTTHGRASVTLPLAEKGERNRYKSRFPRKKERERDIKFINIREKFKA